MKFSNLLLFAGAAAASYRLVKNRQKIRQEVVETADILDRVQNNLANIQRNVAIIQEQRDKLKDITQDLSYKYKLLENQANAQIQQIQDIWQKYET
ncbi:hypothetical protein ACVRXQ_09630 [Streptococcus panodentis]|uniref:Methyl-accepting chemotaxis protein n=1 Tax=Streptococcus panodentis TaxID=1581472 RepID=A0ABS5AX09_9STRE|nr:MULTISPECIES: hypothetical protein [Streptococcus]KXT86036.1 hypothetical protein STRDD11_00074 [Streptococcus sp. DD11]MBP2620786.1 hypothetical protein [Streptococcus panodentis]